MANNVFKVKRTSTSGRTPNTTGSYSTNSQYIAAGEFALNMTDGILYSSNGSAVIEIGANNTILKSTSTITANGIISGSELTSTLASGDEGGQVNLAKPPNATTDGGVTIDAYQNKLRIFEQGGSARGVYIDLTAASAGVGTNLLAAVGSGTVTSVGSANGIAGGPITGSGTLYAVAGNSTLFVNASGIHVNLSSQYVWTNTQTFSANISFTGNNISLVTNTGSIFFAGSSDANWRIGRNTGSTTKYYYTNNSLDIIAANSNLEGIVFGWTGNSYLETGYAGTFTQNPIYVGNSSVNVSINSTAFTGTANNTSFVGSVSAANVVSNSQLSGNLANYQTTAGLSANVATLTANSADYVKANNGITSNSSGVFVTQGDGTTVNSTGVHVRAGTDGGLVSNSTGVFVTAGQGLLTNSTGVHVGTANGITVSADAVGVNAGNTLTVNSSGVHVNSTLQLTTLTTSGNVVVEGNLTVSGNVTVIGANNLSIVDNFIYLNSNNTTQNIDLGFAGNYNDGTYKHAGFFRDASDGFWKPFDGYTPEPDAAVDIDTSNNTFNIAGMWIGNTRIGNTTVYATINSTAYSGSANNSTYFDGYTWAAPPVIGSSTANGASLTYANVSGQVNTATLYATTSANIASAVQANSTGVWTTGTVNAAILSVGTSVVANTTRIAIGTSVGIEANGGIGTTGQLLASNGTSVYWADAPVSNAVYMKGGAATIGTLAEGGSNLFRVNANTLNYNTTISTGENAQATGPITVSSGITLTVESGARVAIV